MCWVGGMRCMSNVCGSRFAWDGYCFPVQVPISKRLKCLPALRRVGYGNRADKSTVYYGEVFVLILIVKSSFW
jgi:hypothetical protein